MSDQVPPSYPPPQPPPPQPYGAPPPGPPSYVQPTQASKGSTGKTCAIIAGIVAILAILGVVAVVIVGKLVVDVVTAPADQTNAYLADLQSGNTTSAYSRLCSAFKAKHSLDDFEEAYDSAIQKNGSIRSYYVYSTNITNETATAEYFLEHREGSESYRVTLVKEGDKWLLCDFTRLDQR